MGFLRGFEGLEEVGVVVFDEVSFDLSLLEFGMLETLTHERDVGGQPDHLDFRQGGVQLGQGHLTVGSPHDDFGDHRVIEHRHLIGLPDTSLDAKVAVIGRELEVVQRPHRRQEVVVRVLSVDARFNSVPRYGVVDGLLVGGDWVTGRHVKLPLHEIPLADHLAHTVLHLQACVHLHEEVVVGDGIEDEFNRSCPFVSDGFGGIDSGFSHLFAQLRRHSRSRCLF
mmetsp:Transcript_1960/g.3829  ORF Transcript_1960/g.3829 Transcript_1960/m.3829 type:complete len:225 (-) Transcript_1960:848-1522(-)